MDKFIPILPSFPPQIIQGSSVQKITGVGLIRIDRTRHILLILPWIGFVIQLVISQSPKDLAAALLAASGSFLIFYDSFRPLRLYSYPLSTLVMMGFAITLQLGPLLFTALEGRSITYNLQAPVETFWHALLTSLACIAAHYFYRNSQFLAQIRIYFNHLLFRFRTFEPLQFVEAVSMGSIGVFALAVSSWFPNFASQQIILVKFIEGLQFFAILPAAFLLQGLNPQQDGSGSRKSYLPFLLFIVSLGLIFFVSIGRNSRSAFVAPIACLAIGLLILWIFGAIRVNRYFFLSAFFAIFFLIPLANDLATAMVMVRGLRGDIPAAELASETFAQLSDRKQIQRFRQLTLNANSSFKWSEEYVSNPFLSRFSNAKFPDNSIVNANMMDENAKKEFTDFQLWRVVSLLPSPLLSELGIPISVKEEVTSVSIGDKLFYLSSGLKSALGGFRTGHFFGTGKASFGFGYLFILVVSLLSIFSLVDSHSIFFAGKLGMPFISIVAITQLISWFTFSNYESVITLLSFPIRQFIEPVVLFAFIRRLITV